MSRAGGGPRARVTAPLALVLEGRVPGSRAVVCIPELLWEKRHDFLMYFGSTEIMMQPGAVFVTRKPGITNRWTVGL